MAQSMKSPIGVPFYWESGKNPLIEWQTRFNAFKMVGMAKENKYVDQLLRLKPIAGNLFYPTIPAYGDRRIENSCQKKERKRTIRNKRRKIDWENKCKHIQNRGPMIDRYTWDDADTEVKNLIFLSLGTEKTRILHQRNPHMMNDHCSTNALAYDLGFTFTRTDNLTFDRFQLIIVRQNPNESLENFLSCLRELGSKAALGNVEEDLLEEFFIAKMNKTAIQLALLSEVRTPVQVLNAQYGTF